MSDSEESEDEGATATVSRGAPGELPPSSSEEEYESDSEEEEVCLCCESVGCLFLCVYVHVCACVGCLWYRCTYVYVCVLGGRDVFVVRVWAVYVEMVCL